jgi:hypothetical protein
MNASKKRKSTIAVFEIFNLYCILSFIFHKVVVVCEYQLRYPSPRINNELTCFVELNLSQRREIKSASVCSQYRTTAGRKKQWRFFLFQGFTNNVHFYVSLQLSYSHN